MISLFEEYVVTTGYIKVKFNPTVKISTIINENFTLALNTATPTLVNDPFETIDLVQDYNSISRILYLSFKSGVLAPNTNYRAIFSGLEEASGQSLQTEYIDFTSPADVSLTEEDEIPSVPEVSIIDYSIIPSVFSSSLAETVFTVDSSDPSNGEIYFASDYENGVLIVKFTKAPSSVFMNEDYIKVQKRSLERGPSRWETVNIQVTASSDHPWAYIYLPAVNDYPEGATPFYSETPIYGQPGYEYISENYKYRIIISKDLQT